MKSPLPVEGHTLQNPSSQPSRYVIVGLALLATLLVFGSCLKAILSLALSDDRYLQIAIAPVACSFLLFQYRTKIFTGAHCSITAGTPLLVFALLAGISGTYATASGASIGLPLLVFGVILTWAAAFVMCCGMQSFRAALYPLSCLLLMIPPPVSWMDQFATGLQKGSAAVSFDMPSV